MEGVVHCLLPLTKVAETTFGGLKLVIRTPLTVMRERFYAYNLWVFKIVTSFKKLDIS